MKKKRVDISFFISFAIQAIGIIIAFSFDNIWFIAGWLWAWIPLLIASAIQVYILDKRRKQNGNKKCTI